MNEKEFSPKIRFKKDDCDWELRKLGELATILRGASPRPIQDPKWFDSNSEVGWLRIADVTQQDGRIFYLEQKISKAGQEKTRVLKDTHLLLSIAATVGKPVVNYVKTGVHDGFIIFKQPSFYIEFMFQWLEMFRPRWQKYGQPGSQVNLNSELVKNQEILLPNFETQVKIGNLFKLLDDKILLHQHELTLLKQRKKAFLQKMFPKKGESVPQVRFSHSNANWERKKLKDVSSYNSSKYSSNHFKKDEFDGLFPVFDANNMIAKINSYDMENEYISIIKDGAGVGRLNKRPAKSSVIGTMGYLTAKNSDVDFLYCLLTTFKFKKFIVGSTIPHVYFKDYGEVKINIPLLEEQKKLGNFFKQLDEDIALHEQKLEKLKEMKKAFLQKMFV